jgi:hypothetical protein
MQRDGLFRSFAGPPRSAVRELLRRVAVRGPWRDLGDLGGVTRVVRDQARDGPARR